MILLGAFWMFIAAMIGAASTLGQGWCRAVVSQGVAFDLRHALFRHIQSLSFANLDQMQTGRLMTRVSSDVDVVRMFSSAGLSLLLRVLLHDHRQYDYAAADGLATFADHVRHRCHLGTCSFAT